MALMLERLGVVLQWIAFLIAFAAGAFAIWLAVASYGLSEDERWVFGTIGLLPSAIVLFLGAGIRWILSGIFTLWPWRMF